MKFSDLSNKRKQAILILVEEYPHILETGMIKQKELRVWWDTKYSKQNERDIGYPIWIFSEPQFRTKDRGVYQIPVPSSEEQLFVQESKPLKIRTKDLTAKEKPVKIEAPKDVLTEDDFLNECRSAGINV
jgi:hypothetical protein